MPALPFHLEMKRALLGAGLFATGLSVGFAVAVWLWGRRPQMEPPAASGPATVITLSALIDGSDRFVFTRDGVTHEHGRWGPPKNVLFNGEPWTDLSQSPAGWKELAGNLDLLGATVVSRKGRDLVVLERMPEGFTLYFADTQMGAGPYEATISIPRR